MKITPINHIKLKNIEPIITTDANNFMGKIFGEIHAAVINTENEAICKAIIKYAIEQGYTDLILIDEEFVKAALLNEIARRKGAK